MAFQYQQAVARVWDSQAGGKVHGAAFAIGECHVMTCAHVIAAALPGCSALQSEAPTDPVWLDFPTLPGWSGRIKAHVVAWQPLDADEDDGLRIPTRDDPRDIAVLKLAEAPTRGLAIPRFLDDDSYAGHSFKASGFPEKRGARDPAYPIDGIIETEAMEGLIALKRNPGTRFVERGFSGTCVWDDDEQAMVGMIVATVDQDQAHMVPVRLLRKVWTDLPLAIPADQRTQAEIYIDRGLQMHTMARAYIGATKGTSFRPTIIAVRSERCHMPELLLERFRIEILRRQWADGDLLPDEFLGATGDDRVYRPNLVNGLDTTKPDPIEWSMNWPESGKGPPGQQIRTQLMAELWRQRAEVDVLSGRSSPGSFSNTQVAEALCQYVNFRRQPLILRYDVESQNIAMTSVREWFDFWRAVAGQQLQQPVVIFLFIVAPEWGNGARELWRHARCWLKERVRTPSATRFIARQAHDREIYLLHPLHPLRRDHIVSWGRWWLEQFAPDRGRSLARDIEVKLGPRSTITMREFCSDFSGFIDRYL